MLRVVLSIATLLLLSWIFRRYLFSLFLYLLARLEPRKTDFRLLTSLRDSLVHERKKKIAALEMILSSWERGEKVQPKFEYFEELLEQLKNLLRSQRRNLMAISRDTWLWAKLWDTLTKIGEISRKGRERSNARTLRELLGRFDEFTDHLMENATHELSFSLNDVVRESVKTVKVEKSQTSGTGIAEQVEDVGDITRFSYANAKRWQRLLTNLIRNACDAVEARKAPPQSKVSNRVVVSTKESDGGSVSVIVEDLGIGMDKTTKSSFFKKGFTCGKQTGLGLGVTEDSVNLIDQYGSWEVDSEKGAGTTITINIDREKARKAELILPPERPFYRRKLALGLSSAVLLMIIGSTLLFAVYPYSRFWVDWNPALVEAQKNHLIVKNKSGVPLWDMFMPSPIRRAYPKKEPLVEVADLDSDGRNEVLVAIDYNKQSTGKVVCFNYRKEKLWEFPCGQAGIYQAAGEANSGYFAARHVVAEDLNGDAKKEIIVNSGHAVWHPGQVAILDERANKLSEYWHPGIFTYLGLVDFNSDGVKEIILGGGNNALDCRPVISVLDPSRVFGQAMPYTAKGDIERAKEEWYVVFPHVKRHLPGDFKWQDFLSWVHKIQFFGEEGEVDVELQDSRRYFMTSDFTVNHIHFSPSSYRAWKERRRFPYDVTQVDEDSWKSIEVWKEGARLR